MKASRFTIDGPDFPEPHQREGSLREAVADRVSETLKLAYRQKNQKRAP